MPVTTQIDALAARVGESLSKREWLAVTQERIDAFAAATGDRQWIRSGGGRPVCVAQVLYRVDEEEPS
jgi:hypothetical protein